MPASDAVVEGVSGGLASIAALLATFPLKTIYTVQALTATKDAQGNQIVMSTLEVIRKYKLTGLYTGVEPNIFESGVSNYVYFYLYSWLRQIAVSFKHKSQGSDDRSASSSGASTSGKNEDIGLAASLLVAGLAGCGNTLVTLPASVLATRMQAQQKYNIDSNAKTSTNPLAIALKIYKEGGVAGFWKGLLPSLVLVANPTVQYMLYEKLLVLLRRYKHQCLVSAAAAKRQAGGEPEPVPETPSGIRLSAGEIFLTSALAKIGATIVTYPLIVIKSRMQAAGKHTSAELQYNGTLHAIIKIFMTEGLSGFFKGLEAKIVQTALNAALLLMLKEQLLQVTRKVLNTDPSKLTLMLVARLIS